MGHLAGIEGVTKCLVTMQIQKGIQLVAKFRSNKSHGKMMS